jgi:putative ABC transport system permease protein
MQGVDMLVPSFREDRENRADYGFRVIGRLRPGVSLEEAQAALDVQAARLQLEYPDTNKGVTPLVKPEPMDRLEPGASAFLPPIAAIFMGLVSLVLLIACANVANLLLARAAGRRKEIALRAALGAGRWRIVRQLLTESLLLAVLGGGAGLLLAHWATGVIGSVRIASDLPFNFRFTPDYHVFGFALALAVLAGVVSGLVPAFQAARTDLNEALKEGGRGAGSGAVRQWLRSSLVVAQVAVAFLFVQSLWNMGSMDLGFRTENRLLLELDLSLRNYDEARGRIFYRDLHPGPVPSHQPQQ